MTPGYTLRLQELAPAVYVWRRAANGGVVVLSPPGSRSPALLLVDTGADDRAAEGLLEVVRGFRAADVVVVNTHGHADHTHGNQALLAAGARLWRPQRGEPFPLPVNDLLIDSLEVPGHTPDSMAVAARGVIFAGDAVYTPDILRRFPIPAYEDVAQALASLERLRRLLCGETASAAPARWLVAGHGRPLQGADAVAALAGCAQAVERVLACLARVLGPGGGGPAAVAAPDDAAVSRWLEATGTPPPRPRAFAYWRCVAAAYARELARRAR